MSALLGLSLLLLLAGALAGGRLLVGAPGELTLVRRCPRGGVLSGISARLRRVGPAAPRPSARLARGRTLRLPVLEQARRLDLAPRLLAFEALYVRCRGGDVVHARLVARVELAPEPERLPAEALRRLADDDYTARLVEALLEQRLRAVAPAAGSGALEAARQALCEQVGPELTRVGLRLTALELSAAPVRPTAPAAPAPRPCWLRLAGASAGLVSG